MFKDRQHAVNQLNRWYRKLTREFGRGDHFGWDLPTLYIVNRPGYNSLMRLYRIAKPYREDIQRSYTS